MINCLLQFDVKKGVVVTEEEEAVKKTPKQWHKQKNPTVITFGECKMAVHDLGRHYPAEMGAPHNKCAALKCGEGRMRFGTQ